MSRQRSRFRNAVYATGLPTIVGRHSPFVFPGSAALLSVDFTSLALGGMTAASFLAQTGLTFTRASVSTVQTGAGTIVSTPGVDEPVIGNRTDSDSNKGLVIQNWVRNTIGGGASADAPRDLSKAFWNAGTAGLAVNQAGSPDGQAKASLVTAVSNQYSAYGGNFNAAQSTFSSFQKGVSKSMARVTSVNTAGLIAVGTPGLATWERLSLSIGAVTEQVGVPCDCRNWAGVPPGSAPADRTVYVDFLQLESGPIATEAIEIGGTERAADLLSYSNGAALIAANGQVKFSAALIPKFSSSTTTYYTYSGATGAMTYWYLFSWGTINTNQARIRISDRKLCVTLAGGVETVSTNAISFTKHDLLEIDLQVGNGVASVALYRVNGGAWTDLVLATIGGSTPNPGAAPVALFRELNPSSINSGNFIAWIKSFSFSP